MRLTVLTVLLLVLVLVLHGVTMAIEPGYLDFDNLPDTNFSCEGKVIGGYYADEETGCQMFHVCTIGQKGEVTDIKFLCLNGTVFDQETRVCERVGEVDCSKTEGFYGLNLELYGNSAGLSLHGEEAEEDANETQLEHQKPDNKDFFPSTHAPPLLSSSISSTTISTPTTTMTTTSPIPIHPFVPTTTTNRPQFHYMSSSPPSITSFLTFSSSDHSLYDSESEGSGDRFPSSGPRPSPWPQVNIEGGGGSGHISKGEHLHDTFHSLKTTPKPINIFSASFNQKSEDHHNPFLFSTTTHPSQHYFTTKRPVGFSITAHPSTGLPFSIQKQGQVHPTISVNAANTSPGYLRHNQGISKEHVTHANSDFLVQQPQNIHRVQNPLHFQFNNRPTHQIFTTPSIAIVSSTSSTSIVSSIQTSIKNSEPHSNSPSSLSVNSFAFGINSGLNSAGFNSKGLVQNGTVTVTVNGQQYGETTPPNSYDEYHESDVSLDPFFRDVPRITKQPKSSRRKRQVTDTLHIPLGKPRNRGRIISGRVDATATINQMLQYGKNNESRARVRPEVQQHIPETSDIELSIPAPDITLSNIGILETLHNTSKNASDIPQPLAQSMQQYENQKLTRKVQSSNTYGINQQPKSGMSRVTQRRRQHEPVLQLPIDPLLKSSVVPEVRRMRQNGFTRTGESDLSHKSTIARHSRNEEANVKGHVKTSATRHGARDHKLNKTHKRTIGPSVRSQAHDTEVSSSISPLLAPVSEESSERQFSESQGLVSTPQESIPDSLPQTGFTCRDKVPGGYYADLEADCQMFHICSQGRHGRFTDNKFLCGPGTRFNQRSRTCQGRDMVDCNLSASFYHLNSHFLLPDDDVTVPEPSFEPHQIHRAKREGRQEHNEGGPEYTLETLPKTSFTCADKSQEGLFADVETQCKGFHLCHKENPDDEHLSLISTFVCPHGTVFNQPEGNCNLQSEVNCQLYSAPKTAFGGTGKQSKTHIKYSYNGHAQHHITVSRVNSKTTTKHFKPFYHPPISNSKSRYYFKQHKNSPLHMRLKREVIDKNNETEEDYYEYDKYERKARSKGNKHKVSTEADSSEDSGVTSFEGESFESDIGSKSASEEEDEKMQVDSYLEVGDARSDEISEQEEDAAHSIDDLESETEVVDDDLPTYNSEGNGSKEHAVPPVGKSKYTTEKLYYLENFSTEVEDEVDDDSLENKELHSNDDPVNNKNKLVGEINEYLDVNSDQIADSGSVSEETYGDSVEYSSEAVIEKSELMKGESDGVNGGSPNNSSEEVTTKKIPTSGTPRVKSDSVEMLKNKMNQLLNPSVTNFSSTMSTTTAEVGSTDYEYYEDYYVDNDEMMEKPTSENILMKESVQPLETSDKGKSSTEIEVYTEITITTEEVLADVIQQVASTSQEELDLLSAELTESSVSIQTTIFYNQELNTESVSENVTYKSDDEVLTQAITEHTERFMEEVSTFKQSNQKDSGKTEREVSTVTEYYLINKIPQSINTGSANPTKALVSDNKTMPYPQNNQTIHNIGVLSSIRTADKVDQHTDLPIETSVHGKTDVSNVDISTYTFKREKSFGNVASTPAHIQNTMTSTLSVPKSDTPNSDMKKLEEIALSTILTSTSSPSSSPTSTIPSLFRPSKLRPVYLGKHSTPVPLPVVIRPKDVLMARKPTIKLNRPRVSVLNKISTDTTEVLQKSYGLFPSNVMEGSSATITIKTTTAMEEPTTIANFSSQMEEQPVSIPVTTDSLKIATRFPGQVPTESDTKLSQNLSGVSEVSVGTTLPSVDTKIFSETQVGPYIRDPTTDSLDIKPLDYDNTPSHVLPTFSRNMFNIKQRIPFSLLHSTDPTSPIHSITTIPETYAGDSGFKITISSPPPLQSGYTLSLIHAQTAIPSHLSDDLKFSCMGKDLNKYYEDPDDRHLFHYCSPGFHRQQVLDFRFMCEGHTVFRLEMQKCEEEQDIPHCTNH